MPRLGCQVAGQMGERGSGELGVDGATRLDVGDVVIPACRARESARPGQPPIVLLLDAQDRVRQTVRAVDGA